jgi:S-methylmethionine-dependent homocysteine/selenocysteine methylase
MCRERGIPYVPIFLDGGFATQCERVGINLDHPLWSTRAVIEDLPQVVRVHAAFFAAGADAVSTATYQCSTGGAEANGTTMDAVAEAAVAAAREAAGASPGRMVWGSLSPIGATLGGGAEYTGAYEFDTDALRAFHRPRVQALLDMNVDVLLLETFPRLDEALAALSAVAELYASNNSEYLPPVCVSFTQKPNSAVPVTGSGDSMMLEAVKKVADFRFVRWIGVNCCTPGAATRYLQLWPHAPVELGAARCRCVSQQRGALDGGPGGPRDRPVGCHAPTRSRSGDWPEARGALAGLGKRPHDTWYQTSHFRSARWMLPHVSRGYRVAEGSSFAHLKR